MATNIFVVGGNGYVGSSVCRAALSRGWNVTSLSRSGKAFKTPGGHTPAWTEKVKWLSGSVFNPSEPVVEELSKCTAVVSTIGTLLPSAAYKQSPQRFVRDMLNGWGISKAWLPEFEEDNPLRAGGAEEEGYEKLNRDAAVSIFNAFSSTTSPFNSRSPFVFISAEDIFRPFIPSGYIQSKREAELTISTLSKTPLARTTRPVFLRPSIIYHAHLRPASTPPAVLTDLSSYVQTHLPLPLKANSLASIFFEKPAQELPSVAKSMANLLSIPPIHVDHVAMAACIAIEREGIEGVVDTQKMRELVGFGEEQREGEQNVQGEHSTLST
ncbi:NAD(P)-binding protein [Atractiella rhizophila]|nr:NAD(P)-binding protein [Atractiella rhizophila]